MNLLIASIKPHGTKPSSRNFWESDLPRFALRYPIISIVFNNELFMLNLIVTVINSELIDSWSWFCEWLFAKRSDTLYTLFGRCFREEEYNLILQFRLIRSFNIFIHYLKETGLCTLREQIYPFLSTSWRLLQLFLRCLLQSSTVQHLFLQLHHQTHRTHFVASFRCYRIPPGRRQRTWQSFCSLNTAHIRWCKHDVDKPSDFK